MSPGGQIKDLANVVIFPRNPDVHSLIDSFTSAIEGTQYSSNPEGTVWPHLATVGARSCDLLWQPDWACGWYAACDNQITLEVTGGQVDLSIGA